MGMESKFIALIDSYREKWYLLRHGNLKATHWQKVVDSVAHRYSAASPPKTAIQCRHKMEKLRKWYRTGLQRARSMPVSRFISSWVHFKRMDTMEKGPSAKPRVNDSDSDENDNNNDEGLNIENDKGLNVENDEEEDQDLYEEFKDGGSNMRHMSFLFIFLFFLLFIFRVFLFGCRESFEKIREKLYFKV